MSDQVVSEQARSSKVDGGEGGGNAIGSVQGRLVPAVRENAFRNKATNKWGTGAGLKATAFSVVDGVAREAEPVQCGQSWPL
jgi:hypothetical protein